MFGFIVFEVKDMDTASSEKKKWWEFIFSPYLKQWAENNLRESYLIWVPDKGTKEMLEDRHIKQT